MQKSVTNSSHFFARLKIKSAISFALLATIMGCGGGYVSKTSGFRSNFSSGAYIEAAEKLEKGAHTEGKDQLLYLLDRATALYLGGAYEESIKDFLKADKLAEINDYTSLSAEAATLFTTEELKHYKGEEFEYVLISQYLAMNYLMLGKWEDALVECRRVNHKLYKLITDGKRKYELNAMARYLAAMIYESRGSYDDAYIDYKAVYDQMPDLPYLRKDLYRLAFLTRNFQDTQRWVSAFQLSTSEMSSIESSIQNPEVVLIIENGKAPHKIPSPQWQAIPTFVPRENLISYVSVDSERSYSAYDVERAAIRNLDEKYGGLLAKKIAGVVAKEVVADQISKKVDPTIGLLFKLGMYASDTADTRSWSTLPKDFQVLRYHPSEVSGDLKLKLVKRGITGESLNSDIEKLIPLKVDRPRVKMFLPVRVDL